MKLGSAQNRASNSLWWFANIGIIVSRHLTMELWWPNTEEDPVLTTECCLLHSTGFLQTLIFQMIRINPTSMGRGEPRADPGQTQALSRTHYALHSQGERLCVWLCLCTVSVVVSEGKRTNWRDGESRNEKQKTAVRSRKPQWEAVLFIPWDGLHSWLG